MSEMTLRYRVNLAVVGPPSDHEGRWKRLAELMPCERHFNEGVALEVVRDALNKSDADYLLLCCAETWLGDLMPVMLNSLLDELSRVFTTWGICSHAGTRADLLHTYEFTRRPPTNPVHAVSPKVVVTLGYGAMLINLRAFRDAQVIVPEIAGCRRPEIVLGFAALERGLPLLADRRLLTGFFGCDGSTPMVVPPASDATKAYLAERVLNNVLITPHDHIDLMSRVAFEALHLPRPPVKRCDYYSLFEGALKARRVKASLTVICRTQLKRPAMLERTVASVAAGAVDAEEFLDLRMMIVSDQDPTEVQRAAEHLRVLAPGLSIETLPCVVRKPRSSRVDLILQALEAARTDYVWFVDDDDFIYPAAARLLGALLLPGYPTLVVGGAQHFEERWSAPEPDTRHIALVDSYPTDFVGAGGVVHSFDGENHIPICGLVLPRATVLARLSTTFALGDYLEDYFMLLRTLTAPSLEIEILHGAISGISNRGTENTGRSKDRSEWNRSYITFFQELLLRADDTSPAWWQMCGH